MVRPWNAPSVATRWVRPVRRVSLSAASLASAPELEKNTLPRRGGRHQRQQPLGELDLRRGGEEVGDVAERAQLGGHGLDEGGVGVAEGVDGDAAEEVEVLPALVVPDVGALAAHQRQLGRAEGVHQRRGVALQQLAHGGSVARCRRRSRSSRAPRRSGLADLGLDAGQHLGADALVGEQLEQHGVRLPAVDDGGPRDAARDGVVAGPHLRHHAAGRGSASARPAPRG